MSTLSENLRAARIKAKKKQWEVAIAIYRSPGTISHFETGRSVPDAEMLQLIAEYLNTSVEELTEGSIPIDRVKRVRDVFPDLDEKGSLLLRRIWKDIVEYMKDL